MKKKYSIKSEFLIMYIVSFFLPIIISASIISIYLKLQFGNQITDLVDDHLKSVTKNITAYLDDLNRLTTLPYYDSNFINSLNTLNKKDEQDTTAYERFLAEKAFKEKLSKYMTLTHREIISAVLVKDNAIIFGVRNTGDNISVCSYDFSKKDWYISTVNNQGKPYITGIHSQDYFFDAADIRVFSVARQLRDPVSGENLGVIMADADTRVLNDIFSNINLNISTKIALLDESNNIVFSTGDITNDFLDKMKGNSTINDGKESYTVKVENIENYNWKIAMFVSNSSINKRIVGIYEVCAILLFLGLAVTFFIFNILSNDISIPIKKIIKVMEQVEKGDFSLSVSKFRIFEMEELSGALNNMIEKLNESIEKEYKQVIQQKNAEFKALQSQISPHFLYNTLNGFIGLNRIGERELLEKSIFNLTRMLRFSLENRNFVTIKEEFDFLSEYGDLQLMRFGDRMKIKISYDEEIKDYLIPKFLLQPIVENAMIHGIEPCEKECTLDIIGTFDDKDIIFIVKDNGIGFDINTIKEGVGISNIKNRLKLFNNNSKFHIEGSPDEGTHVEIMISKEELMNENSDCR